jgi:hypothetical protein
MNYKLSQESADKLEELFAMSNISKQQTFQSSNRNLRVEMLLLGAVVGSLTRGYVVRFDGTNLDIIGQPIWVNNLTVPSAELTSGQSGSLFTGSGSGYHFSGSGSNQTLTGSVCMGIQAGNHSDNVPVFLTVTPPVTVGGTSCGSGTCSLVTVVTGVTFNLETCGITVTTAEIYALIP